MAQWTTSEAWINYQRVSILDLQKRMGVYRTDLEFTETQRGEGEAGGKSERNPSLHSQTVTDQRAGSTDYQNHGRPAAMSVMYGKYRALQKNGLVETVRCDLVVRVVTGPPDSGQPAFLICFFLKRKVPRGQATPITVVLSVSHELEVDKTRLFSAYCLVILFPEFATSTKTAPSELHGIQRGLFSSLKLKKNMGGPFFVLMGRQVALINTSTFHGGHPSSPAQQ